MYHRARAAVLAVLSQCVRVTVGYKYVNVHESLYKLCSIVHDKSTNYATSHHARATVTTIHCFSVPVLCLGSTRAKQSAKVCFTYVVCGFAYLNIILKEWFVSYMYVEVTKDS